MKKTILGITWQVLGFAGAIVILCTAVQHPWNYNGTKGIIGGLLGNELMTPFIICISMFVIGIALVLFSRQGILSAWHWCCSLGKKPTVSFVNRKQLHHPDG